MIRSSFKKHFAGVIGFGLALLMLNFSARAESKTNTVPKHSPARIETQICIYGGTSAGIAAAIQASRSGKTCVLLNPDSRLGGLTSNGLGWTDLGEPDAIGGIAREFYHRIYQHYARASAWTEESRARYVARCGLRPDEKHQLMFTFEPKVALIVFEEMLRDASVKIIPGRIKRPGGVRKSGNHLQELITDDGQTIIAAEQFIDTTYEGDLLAEAGVSFTIGREAREKYQEKLAGIQTARATKNQLPDGIDPYVIPGKSRSGLLPGIRASAGGKDGEGDHRLQAFCYRMCLTDVASNRVAIAKPAGYRETDFELLLRAIEAGQTQRFFKLSPLPNRKTDSNNDAGFSTDFIGGNYDLAQGWNYAEASYRQRAEIDSAHRTFQEGLVWTLQHHPRVPARIRRAWSAWGLPLDEFSDNAHWPPGLYVREARRMVSDFVITEHEVHQEPGHIAADSIGMGGYNMDSHHVQRHVTPQGFVQNEGDIQVAPRLGPYGISYRALIPQSSEAENLIVPVCVSASHVAFGSIRMEPVFMILGQSAGVAAAIAIDDHAPVQKVSYSKLRKILLEAGQILELKENQTRE